MMKTVFDAYLAEGYKLSEYNGKQILRKDAEGAVFMITARVPIKDISIHDELTLMVFNSDITELLDTDTFKLSDPV
jgi:hypothetical protein